MQAGLCPSKQGKNSPAYPSKGSSPPFALFQATQSGTSAARNGGRALPFSFSKLSSATLRIEALAFPPRACTAEEGWRCHPGGSSIRIASRGSGCPVTRTESVLEWSIPRRTYICIYIYIYTYITTQQAAAAIFAVGIAPYPPIIRTLSLWLTCVGWFRGDNPFLIPCLSHWQTKCRPTPPIGAALAKACAPRSGALKERRPFVTQPAFWAH